MSMLYQKNIVKQIANVGIIRINVKKLMHACYNLSLFIILNQYHYHHHHNQYLEMRKNISLTLISSLTYNI